jgi:hypothetical protein
VLSVVLMFGASCASCGSAFVAKRPYAAPSGEKLLGELRRRHAAVARINLETRTTSWLGGERLAADVPMVVERAGRLRFDPEISLQGTVASLITDGSSFALADLRKQIFQRGPACPANVALLIRIPLVPAEIAAILLGDAPLPADARATEILWDGHRAADVLVVEGTAGPDGTGRLFISWKRAPSGRSHVVAVEGEAPARAGRGQGQPGRWRVQYEEPVDVRVGDGVWSFPRLIRFAEPGRDFDDGVLIKIAERTVNPPVRDQAFALVPPEGFVVEEIPCCQGCQVVPR